MKLGYTKPLEALWRWGRSYFPKRRRTFTPRYGCLPENILLNSVAAQDSGLNNREVFALKYFTTVSFKHRVNLNIYLLTDLKKKSLI